jgi:hypothetical protein
MALPEDFTGLITNGPALFYVTTQNQNGTQSVQRIDLDCPAEPRERAVCRALLAHALALLDASEPARQVAPSACRALGQTRGNGPPEPRDRRPHGTFPFPQDPQ